MELLHEVVRCLELGVWGWCVKLGHYGFIVLLLHTSETEAEVTRLRVELISTGSDVVSQAEIVIFYRLLVVGDVILTIGWGNGTC
jgi:hypothetical protein